MNCPDCKGSGKYEGIGILVEDCSLCKGSGVVPTDTNPDPKSLAQAYYGGAGQVPVAPVLHFSVGQDVTVQSLGGGTVRGSVRSITTPGGVLSTFTLDCTGSLIGQKMDFPINVVAWVRDSNTGNELWPCSAPKGVNYNVHVSTMIAGTAVKTGDMVEVHTRLNTTAHTKYVGELFAVNATTIEVGDEDNVDIIPINEIDRLIVTFATGGFGPLVNPSKGTVLVTTEAVILGVEVRLGDMVFIRLKNKSSHTGTVKGFSDMNASDDSIEIKDRSGKNWAIFVHQIDKIQVANNPGPPGANGGGVVKLSRGIHDEVVISGEEDVLRGITKFFVQQLIKNAITEITGVEIFNVEKNLDIMRKDAERMFLLGKPRISVSLHPTQSLNPNPKPRTPCSN